MYRPLPDGLTIKNSPIEGLGLFTNIAIKKNTFIGITHIRDEQFENKYIRTPLGGFYNHSNEPTIIRMVSDVLPKLKFGDHNLISFYFDLVVCLFFLKYQLIHCLYQKIFLAFVYQLILYLELYLLTSKRIQKTHFF